MWLELVTLAAFVLISLMVFITIRSFTGREDPIYRRINDLPLDEVGSPSDEPLYGEVTESLAAPMTEIQGETALLTRELRRAGNYRASAVQEYRAKRNLMVLGMLLATAAVVMILGPENSQIGIWVGAAGFILALLLFAMPRISLRRRGNRRIERMERGLPDALDIITMCIAGGLPLRQSLGYVSHEIHDAHPDLSTELHLVDQQARMGTLSHAFGQFAERTDSGEVRALSGLIADSEKLGANVETAVQNHADRIRRLYRQRADARASRTGVKMALPFAFCILPAMLVLLISPAILNLRSTVNDIREIESEPGGIFGTPPQELIEDERRRFDELQNPPATNLSD